MSMPFAMDIAVAATAILLAARLSAAFTDQPSLRHMLRLGGFGALLLLPCFFALLPSALALRRASAVIAPGGTAPHLAAGAWIAIALVALWAAGVLVLLARTGRGAMALGALLRGGEPHGFPATRLAEWQSRAGVGRPWELRLSRATDTPISWGVFRPVVLLPRACADWEGAQLDAAMLHELAHLRRRDSLAQALVQLACALYWPHPLVWREARALKADAEQAADDAVLLSGARPSDYADLLLKVAHDFDGPRSRLAFSMAERRGLETRIQSILSDRPRAGVTMMQILKTVAFVLSAALVLALIRPTFVEKAQASPSLAQNTVPEVHSSATQDALAAPAANEESARPATATTREARRRARANRQRIGDALVQAHIGDTVAKAMAGAHIPETVAKAVADAHIDEIVAKALTDAHINEKIAAALKQAHPAIDAAIAQAQAQQAFPQPTPKAAP